MSPAMRAFLPSAYAGVRHAGPASRSAHRSARPRIRIAPGLRAACLVWSLVGCSSPPGTTTESTEESGPSCALEVAVCEQFALTRASCEPGVSVESARAFCEGEVSSSFDNSCACGQAIEDWYACMGELECSEFDYQDPFEGPCNPAAAYNLCGEG